MQPAFDVDAYLAWEDKQAEKHEYVRGEVFAMVGARREHVVVTLNLASAFKQRLRGGPCQAYISDLKLRVESADAFFYPDVIVSRDTQDQTASQFACHPILIVEVLSESTAAFDPQRHRQQHQPQAQQPVQGPSLPRLRHRRESSSAQRTQARIRIW